MTARREAADASARRRKSDRAGSSLAELVVAAHVAVVREADLVRSGFDIIALALGSRASAPDACANRRPSLKGKWAIRRIRRTRIATSSVRTGSRGRPTAVTPIATSSGARTSRRGRGEWPACPCVYQFINGDLNSSSASFYEWGVRHHTWHPVGSGYVAPTR